MFYIQISTDDKSLEMELYISYISQKRLEITTSRNVIVNTFSKIEIWQHFYYFFLLSFFILLTVFQNANSITLSSMLLAYKIIIAIKELSFVKKINKFLVADRILCIWSILTNNNIFNVFKRFYIVKYHRQIY